MNISKKMIVATLTVCAIATPITWNQYLKSKVEAAENAAVERVVSANQAIFDQEHQVVRQQQKRLKELNDIAYDRGEQIKVLQQQVSTLQKQLNESKQQLIDIQKQNKKKRR